MFVRFAEHALTYARVAWAKHDALCAAALVVIWAERVEGEENTCWCSTSDLMWLEHVGDAFAAEFWTLEGELLYQILQKKKKILYFHIS